MIVLHYQWIARYFERVRSSTHSATLPGTELASSSIGNERCRKKVVGPRLRERSAGRASRRTRDVSLKGGRAMFGLMPRRLERPPVRRGVTPMEFLREEFAPLF